MSYTKTQEITAQRLKEKRNQCMMTLEEVSQKIDITPVTLHKYENLKVTNIPIEKLEQLAEVYNTTPAYLVGWTDDEHGNGQAKMQGHYISIYNDYLKIVNAKDRLIAIRENNEFTKSEFASALNISMEELFECENGSKEISLDMIERIEKWFHVPKEVWLIGDGVSQTTKDYISNLAEKQKQEIENFIFEQMISILRKDGYNVEVQHQNTPKEYWRITNFFLPVDILDIQKSDLLDIMLSAKNIFIELLKSYGSGYTRQILKRAFKIIGG